MKKFLTGFMFLIILSGCSNGIREVYVSPDGNDSNDGTIEHPLRTPDAAINKLKGHGGTVWLRGGIYEMEHPLVLRPENSGVSFKACKGETPVLSGAQKIRGWHKLENDLPEISKSAKGKVWVADIHQGWLPHFFFVNGRRAQRSRWINNNDWRNWPKDHQPGKPDQKGQLVTLTANTGILKYLPGNGDAEMVCIIAQYGVMGNGVIRDVDAVNGTFRWNSRQLNLRKSRNPHERGYNLENALCFIDEPGEWAVNSKAGKIYYWPVDNEDLRTDISLAPGLYELVRLQGNEDKGEYVQDITFEEITLKYTDRLPEDQWPYTWLMRQWENVDATLYVTGAQNCTFTNNRILNAGAYGITLNHHARRIRVEHNEVGFTGSGGIFLEGYGPGKKDVNRENVIKYNYVHDHGLANYWHSPSIQIYQSGHNDISYNLLQRSAYSGISMVGMNPVYMSNINMMEPGHFTGQWQEWNYFCPRLQDYPEDIRKGIRKGEYIFDRETVKPYLLTNKNYVFRNVIVEPHSLLNEGGAIYAWCTGKDNIWNENVIFVSHAMPGSSILALDDMAEYFTVVGNVFWVNGKILDGVGMRKNERGNMAKNNIRVMFKKDQEARRSDGLGTRWINDEGREPLDKLFAKIKAEIKKTGWKSWPGDPAIGIPEPDSITTLKKGKDLVLPEGSNVTIEDQ
jgi:hypothetical protein